MFFLSKNKTDKITQAIEQSQNNDYWTIVRRQFFKNRLAAWSLRIFYVILFIAITADFTANEQPIYCKIDGETYFPICRQYLVDLGLATWDEKFVSTKWLEQKYDYVIFPPITYSSTTRDSKNNKFKNER